MPARALLERLYGFAEPTATADGRLTYACLYCDASSDDGHDALGHDRDCGYWHLRVALASPAARRLVAQVGPATG